MPTEPLQLIALSIGLPVLLAGWLLYFGGLWSAGCILWGTFGVATGISIAKFTALAAPWDIVLAATLGVVGALIGLWIVRFAHRMVFLLGGFVAGVVLAWNLRNFLTSAMPDYAAWVSEPAGAAALCVMAGVVAALLCLWIDWLLIAIASAGLGALLVGFGAELEHTQTAAVMMGGLIVQVGLASILGGRKRRARKKGGQEED